jgi:hypothetical protein
MVEGRGIRHWEEGVYLFRSEDREAAFQRALEIGEGGQSGGEEETRRRTRWVETRFAATRRWASRWTWTAAILTWPGAGSMTQRPATSAWGISAAAD